MPRKRPRNPLKRKQIDFDVDPGKLINPSKRKRTSTQEDEEELGGSAPKAFQRLMNWAQKKQTLKEEPERENRV